MQPLKSEIMEFSGKWIELKKILSEVTQMRTDKYGMYLLTCGY